MSLKQLTRAIANAALNGDKALGQYAGLLDIARQYLANLPPHAVDRQGSQIMRQLIDALSAAPDKVEAKKCEMCNGHGLVGGMTIDGGEGYACPDCDGSGECAPRAAIDQATGGKEG